MIGRDVGDVGATTAELSTDPANDLVSRRHARVSFDGTAWQLTDLESRRGIYIDGVRVRQQRLAGNVVAMLGSPTSGERIVFEAAGAHRRRIAPRTLIAAAAAVLAIVVALGLVIVRSGGNDAANPAGNDITRMKLATGLVIAIGANGDAKGSSTIICGDNLVLTNAHVAQPDTPGQGVLYGSADDPIEALYLAYPGADDPDGIVSVRYRAEVVAYDGYIDAAALRIVGEASGSYPDIVDGPAIEDASKLDLPCADLPDSGSVPSKTAVDVYGYPGVTGSDDPDRFFDVQLDADSNEITSYTEDVLLGERQGWINLGRDIQGGNSGGLVAEQPDPGTADQGRGERALRGLESGPADRSRTTRGRRGAIGTDR